MGRHRGYTVDDYRKAAASGLSMMDTARLLNVSAQTVFVMAKKHGITFKQGKRGRKPSAGATEQ